MPSTLTWIDYDPAQRERTNRVLLLFSERGTVDQLGFGSVRDAFADRLFPGTSVIQTRLRYFLFVAWMYRELERSHVPSRQIAARASDYERSLVTVLRATGERGVLGGTAGEELKILPSAIYWGGLRSWGIRRYPGSRGMYHHALDSIYERRKHTRHADPESEPDDSTATWHVGLPEPPDGWPAEATLELRRAEAELIQGRILTEHPTSLLALLARDGVETDVAYPWQHPAYASFHDHHKRLLHHARLFSEMKHGAALLYNLALAEQKGVGEHIDRYRAELAEWQAGLDVPAVQAWDLDELWALTLGQGHTITPSTRDFVQRWVAFVRADRPLAANGDARDLVRLREMRLKGARSKFNAGPLEAWSGESGVGRLDYRWPVVQSHLNDLYRGLAGS